MSPEKAGIIRTVQDVKDVIGTKAVKIYDPYEGRLVECAVDILIDAVEDGTFFVYNDNGHTVALDAHEEGWDA